MLVTPSPFYAFGTQVPLHSFHRQDHTHEGERSSANFFAVVYSKVCMVVGDICRVIRSSSDLVEP